MQVRRQIMFTILAFFCAIPIFSDSGLEAVDQAMLHATTCYWIGMADKGNMDDFARGLAYLETARQRLRTSDLDDERNAEYGERIDALEADLLNQQDLAHDTFYGLFPLVRLLGSGTFASWGATTMYELYDDPAVLAATNAGAAAMEQISANWKAVPQLDVVVASDPPDTAIENELLYLFNTDGRYYIHQDLEVVGALSPQQYAQLHRDGATPGIVASLKTGFSTPNLLIVDAQMLDRVDGDYFYNVRADYYSDSVESPAHVVQQMGFARDRTGMQWWITTTQIVLAVLGIGIYVIGSRTRTAGPAFSGQTIATAIVLFGIGRLVPVAINPLLAGMAPEPETLIHLAAWWIGAFGLLLLLVPWLLLRLLLPRIRSAIRLHDLKGIAGTGMATIAIGISAYLAIPSFLYLESAAVPFLGTTTAAAVLMFFSFGRATDSGDDLPTWTALIPVVFALGFGAALLSGHAGVMAVFCVLFLIVAGSMVMVHRMTTHVEVAEGVEAELPASDDLIGRAIAALETRPGSLFVETEAFAQARDLLSSDQLKHPRWVALVGDEGTGKTATATALVTHMVHTMEEQGATPVIMRGIAPEPVGTAESYALFSTAFKGNRFLEALISTGDQFSNLDEGLKEIANSVLPLPVSMLFPGEGAEGPESKEEILASIADTVLRIAAKRPMLLVLEDLHWIDPESRELLVQISRAAYESGAELTAILTSRTREPVEALAFEPHIVEISETGGLTDQGKLHILTERLRLTEQAAIRVVEDIGGLRSQRGEHYVFFRNVGHLLRSGVFEQTSGAKLAISNTYRKPGSLPLASELFTEITDKLDAFPEYKEVLECAACIGVEFDADLLAESLELTRLRTISLLEEVEHRTGFLHDVRETDDIYRFNSVFLLEVIRERMSILGSGPASADIPQVVREYHLRLATTLERRYRVRSDEKTLFSLVRHYYASGVRGAEQGIARAIEAADSASRVFAHHQAFEFLRMGEEMAGFTDSPEKHSLAIAQRVIAESMVSGRFDLGAARMLDLHRNAIDLPLDLVLRGLEVCGAHAREASPEERARFTAAIDSMVGRLLASGEPCYRAWGLLHAAQYRHGLDEAIEDLKQGVGLLEDMDLDPETMGLLARLHNSLGNKLISRDAEESERHFLTSIDLRRQAGQSERQGIAYDFGGLGRLHLFATHEYHRAIEYFAQALEIAAEIDDLDSLRTVESLLASSYEKAGDTASALEHFSRSLELVLQTPGPSVAMDQFFALAGVLANTLLLAPEESESRAEALLAHLETYRLPVGAIGWRITEILAIAEEFSDREWHVALSERLAEEKE